MNKPEYLGDGVYANFDGYHVVLTTGPSNNPIYLDQAVWQALVDYGERVFTPPVEETLYGNCSVCGEPMYNWQFQGAKPHPYELGDCHDECCPVCHEGEPPYGA